MYPPRPPAAAASGPEAYDTRSPERALCPSRGGLHVTLWEMGDISARLFKVVRLRTAFLRFPLIIIFLV
jgi:hypothetical protein